MISFRIKYECTAVYVPISKAAATSTTKFYTLFNLNGFFFFISFRFVYTKSMQQHTAAPGKYGTNETRKRIKLKN